MTITNQQCVNWGNMLREQAENFYVPRIRELEKIIQEKQAAGEDPSNVKLLGGAVTVNYPALLKQVIETKNQAVNKANQEEQSCQNGAVPNWLGDVQKASDIALTIVILPFVALTQNYAAAHIDLGEVYKGRPLGGDNALIPKARTDVLDALQIHGAARKFLENPIIETGNAVGGAIESIIKGIGDVFRNPFG